MNGTSIQVERNFCYQYINLIINKCGTKRNANIWNFGNIIAQYLIKSVRFCRKNTIGVTD